MSNLAKHMVEYLQAYLRLRGGAEEEKKENGEENKTCLYIIDIA